MCNRKGGADAHRTRLGARYAGSIGKQHPQHEHDHLQPPGPKAAQSQHTATHLLLSELAPNATPSKGVHELEYGAKRASGRRHVEDGWGAKAASGGSCRFHGLLLLHPRGTSRGSRHPYQETGACPRPHSSCSHHCTPDNRRHRGPGSCQAVR